MTLTDYMYQERRNEEELPAVKKALTHRYNDYIEKHEGGLITAIRNDSDNTMDNRMIITRKEKWEENQLHGRFKRLINNISHDKTWTWPKKGNFKRETESLLISAQNNAIRTNHIKGISSFDMIRIIRRNKRANVGYVVIETKRSISANAAN